MSIDVFGHGPRRLPSTDTQFYSDGPDRKRGPAKCRGVVGGCYDGAPNPHDHSCCCDPCRHKYVELCGSGNCCRCIPKQICAIFTPDETSGSDEPDPFCVSRVWKMTPETVSSRSVYSFNFGLNSVELSVGRDLDGYPGECTWRLHSEDLGVDQSVAIQHSGDVHCQAPPDFTIENVNLIYHDVQGYSHDCFGTLTFGESTLAKVPFVYRWRDQEEFATVACASCDQICRVLCVRRGNEYESDHTRTEFFWDEYAERWNADDDSGHFITLHEEYGNCYLKLDSITPATLQGDLILIDTYECSIGMDLTVVDEVGDYIKISCNPCSCWDYLCGTCRCVCPALCVVGVQDGELVAPFTIQWDKNNLRWGDDTFSVTPSKDEDGNCVASVTGYADPVEMPNACGGDMAFQVSESMEDQLESGLVNYLYFRCADCTGECGPGTCLDICDEVPSVLFAEVSAAEWTPMLGCNPLELCFETITFPLVQVFVSTLSNPAGEWRWIGSGIISCKNCSSPTRKNYLVTVDIGCDGEGTFQVTGNDIVAQCLQTFGFELPCTAGEWDFSFGPWTDCDGLNGCCDEGGFNLSITE